MDKKIYAEEVAQQFAIAIQLLLEWAEQRDKVTTQFIIKPKFDEYGKNEILNAAEAAKILKIGKSKMYQMMQRGENQTVQFGRSVGVRVKDLEKFVDDNVSPRNSVPGITHTAARY